MGAGAFGVVWRARDPELDRLVALKLLHPGLAGSAANRERFQREARAAAQLRHPGIVTVHEVTTLEGVPAIVSQFIDGVTLRAFLQVRRLTFREADHAGAGILVVALRMVDETPGETRVSSVASRGLAALLSSSILARRVAAETVAGQRGSMRHDRP